MGSRGHTYIVAFCTVAIQHVSESKVFRCLSGYDQVERSIFQTFWKPHYCAKCLFIKFKFWLLAYFSILNCAKFEQDWTKLITYKMTNIWHNNVLWFP